MTKKEIELFNSFLTDLNMSALFKGRVEESNASYDGYLSEVSTEEVFGFVTEEHCPDRDMWLATADLWQDALREAKPSDAADDEELAVTPVVEPEPVMPDKYKFCPSCWQLKDVNDFGRNFIGIRNTYCRDCYIQYRNPTLQHAPVGFSVYEAIQINSIVYLNMALAELLREKKMNHCGLRHHEGQLFLVFCEQKKHRNLKYYKNGGVSIMDAALCADILETLSVTDGGPYHLHISLNRSKRFDAVTIQVLRAVTHKEYLQHPFVKAEEKQEIQEEQQEAMVSTSSVDQQPSAVADDGQGIVSTPSNSPSSPLSDSSSTKGYKFCISCLRPLPLTDYYKSVYEYDGMARVCKSCVNYDFSHDSSFSADAVYFGGRLFFSKEISEMISDRRKCEIETASSDKEFVVLRIPNAGGYPGSSRRSDFTSCQRSGTVALREESLLHELENTLHLDKDHAYRFLFSPETDASGNLRLFIGYPLEWQWKNDYPELLADTDHEVPSLDAVQHEEPSVSAPQPLSEAEVAAKMKEFFTLYPSITIKQLHNILSQAYDADEETGINKYELGLAAYLKERDWKLQMPVRVIKYEEF